MDDINVVDTQAMSSSISVAQYRDEVHKQLARDLQGHVRQVTGFAAILQAERRRTDSRHSSLNKYAGTLPTEDEWKEAWSVRECLKLVAKIPPRQLRATWTFSDGDASFLADFLGMPGDKGARKGREWAKNDWARAVMTVFRLAEDFGYDGFDRLKLAEYEYSIMDVFAMDNYHT